MDKYRKLLKKTKEARVEQIILSGILPVFGNRLDGIQKCEEDGDQWDGEAAMHGGGRGYGYVDLWDSLVGKEVDVREGRSAP